MLKTDFLKLIACLLCVNVLIYLINFTLLSLNKLIIYRFKLDLTEDFQYDFKNSTFILLLFVIIIVIIILNKLLFFYFWF